ncbi:hypothetical protein J6590_039100 [Homalodisca vitripennis]|nr:hypothetical protein J6590_039100 [Homalodisca vitripennis]
MQRVRFYVFLADFFHLFIRLLEVSVGFRTLPLIEEYSLQLFLGLRHQTTTNVESAPFLLPRLKPDAAADLTPGIWSQRPCEHLKKVAEEEAQNELCIFPH